MKNKKAMMDDLFDFLFTVIAAFFILFFMGIVISGGQKGREEQTAAQLEILKAEQNFLYFLKTPINEKETILNLIAGIDFQDRSEEFKEKVKEIIGELYPSTVDYWWIRIYAKDEEPAISLEEGKYKDYSHGVGHCRPHHKRYITTQFLVPKFDGDNVKLVFCVSPYKFRGRTD